MQIAEILYQSTAFESALVYFHRGKKIRPAANDFVLGVTKSEAAITNVIGGKQKIYSFNMIYMFIRQTITLFGAG